MYSSTYDVSGKDGVAATLAKTIGLHSHWGFSAGFDFIEAFTGDFYCLKD